MILSDGTLRSRPDIVVAPLLEDAIQPASIDIRLGSSLLWYSVYGPEASDVIDTREVIAPTEGHDLAARPFDLAPGRFVLGHTLEHIEVPTDLAARIEGKSSLGRLGLMIHSTAGYVDPGWRGQLTLELSNVNHRRIRLYEGMKIGHLSFIQLTAPAEKPYGSAGLGSRYQDSVGPVGSLYGGAE